MEDYTRSTDCTPYKWVYYLSTQQCIRKKRFIGVYHTLGKWIEEYEQYELKWDETFAVSEICCAILSVT